MTQHHILEGSGLHIYLSEHTGYLLVVTECHCVNWILCTCRFTGWKMSWGPNLIQKKGKG